MSWLKNNLKAIALLTSLAIIGIAIFIAFFIYLIQGQGSIATYLLTLLVFFVFVYFIIYQTLDAFIYSKIKLIYKTIHRSKLEKGSIVQQYDRSSESLDAVNKEVESWTKRQSEEIASLKEMARYRRDFLGNVSHELKTPIFSIQGYIMTLLDGGIDDSSINTKYLKKSIKNIDRMIDMVDDLETISALESGRLDLNISTFDMVEYVTEIIDSYEYSSKKYGIDIFISNKFNHPEILVEADQEKLRQVFTNLIDNAIKYIGVKPNPRIKISFYDLDENVLIEISDNGIGISEEYIPRLFERFYRIDQGRSREHGGTGLGLAIVKHIMEAHKQTINIRSSLDIGTTFSFTLKCAIKN